MSPIMLSIIIPVFNESKILEDNITLLNNSVESITTSYEIILAEDGSTDETYNICKRLENNPNIRVLHHPERQGKGNALKSAFNSALGDIVIFMDADLSVNLDSLCDLISPLSEEYSMVVGSRYAEGARINRGFVKTFKSRLYNFMVNLFFRTNILDHQCGYKSFNREHLEPILSNVSDGAFFFDTELIIRTKEAGLKIIEIPVEWSEPERRKSRVGLYNEFNIFLKLFSFIKKHYFNSFSNEFFPVSEVNLLNKLYSYLLFIKKSISGESD